MIVDLEAPASPQPPLRLRFHHREKPWEWDPSRLRLWVPEPGITMDYDEVERALWFRHPLNANAVDFCIRNPSLTPKSWYGEDVLFIGTWFHDSCRYKIIRSLRWRGGAVTAGTYWVGGKFDFKHPVAYHV